MPWCGLHSDPSNQFWCWEQTIFSAGGFAVCRWTKFHWQFLPVGILWVYRWYKYKVRFSPCGCGWCTLCNCLLVWRSWYPPPSCGMLNGFVQNSKQKHYRCTCVLLWIRCLSWIDMPKPPSMRIRVSHVIYNAFASSVEWLCVNHQTNGLEFQMHSKMDACVILTAVLGGIACMHVSRMPARPAAHLHRASGYALVQRCDE